MPRSSYLGPRLRHLCQSGLGIEAITPTRLWAAIIARLQARARDEVGVSGFCVTMTCVRVVIGRYVSDLMMPDYTSRMSL
jgi:hypothetical protein